MTGLSRLEAETLETAAKSALAEAERSCGARLVSVGARKDLRQDLALEVVERRSRFRQIEDDLSARRGRDRNRRVHRRALGTASEPRVRRRRRWNAIRNAELVAL